MNFSTKQKPKQEIHILSWSYQYRQGHTFWIIGLILLIEVQSEIRGYLSGAGWCLYLFVINVIPFPLKYILFLFDYK